MREKDLNKPTELLEKCFDCFCENGLEDTGTKKLAKACNMSPGNLFHYFETKDEIVTKATAHCMAKVEDDFMAHAPKSFEEIETFLNEMPYITARDHGAKYRFMYQVYSSPRYQKEGKEFFAGVAKRYAAYSEQLAPKLGLPKELLQGFIYTFVRACVHFAMFEDEEYLKLQLGAIRTALNLFMKERSKG